MADLGALGRLFEITLLSEGRTAGLPTTKPASIPNTVGNLNMPIAESYTGSFFEGRAPMGLRTPQIQFFTQVDGVNETKPVALLVGNSTFKIDVNQPSTLYGLPTSRPVEVLVYGEGDKRSEVWGPYILPASTAIVFSGTPPAGVVGVAYEFFFSLTGYISPAVWTYTGELPPGLDIDGPEISGIPTTVGTYKLTVMIRAGDGAVRYRDLSIVVT